MKVSKREVEALLEKVLDTQTVLYGINLRHGSDPEVEIFVDQQGGMSLEECAKLHRSFAKQSEGTNLDDYRVSFSTPGADRSCVFPRDFLFYGDKEFYLVFKDDTEICGKVEIPDPEQTAFILYPTDAAPIECMWEDVRKAGFKFGS